MKSTNLDLVLARSLQAQSEAGSLIEPQMMLHTAATRGRRMRTRRRLATGLLATIAVFAVVAPNLQALKSVVTPNNASPAEPILGLAVPLAVPPDAPGEAGAVTKPALVATNPRVVHFSLDALSKAARSVTYLTGPGFETAEVQQRDFQLYVSVSRDRASLPPQRGFMKDVTMSEPVVVRIAGVEGTVTTGIPVRSGLAGSANTQSVERVFSVLWQPDNGFWASAQVQTAATIEDAVRVVEMVQFDRAKKCVLPFSIGAFPTGATMQSCGISFYPNDRFGFLSSGRVAVGTAGRDLNISFMEIPGGGPIVGHLKAGPYSVAADPDGKTWVMSVGSFGFTMTNAKKGNYTENEILRILGSIRMSGDPRKPATW